MGRAYPSSISLYQRGAMPRWVAAPLTSLDVTLVFIAQPLTFQLGSPSMPSLRFLTLQIARAQRPQPLRVVKVIHWNKQTAQMQAVRRDMVSSQARGARRSADPQDHLHGAVPIRARYSPQRRSSRECSKVYCCSYGACQLGYGPLRSQTEVRDVRRPTG